jgi:DNA-binding NarL/FixJ family response regulator
LSALPDLVFAEAATGREALVAYREGRPDVVILDLNLPGVGGLELLQRLVIEDPTACVLVFSMHAEAIYVSRALQVGARGYMSKNATPEELLVAVQRLADGGSLQQLTKRDLEIIRLLGDGRNLAEIAAELGISYKTVANTCSQIKAKLGVARTADLIRLSIEHGIL